MSLKIELLEQSFERIKPRASDFVASFYENLFTSDPELVPLFAKVDMATQHKKLLAALVLVVENLRNPEALGEVLNALGARHVGYGAIPKYYGAVVFVFTDENSLLGKALGGADTISLVVALVLFIKEAPDRRKQFHYQAWSTIDAAHNVKVSYARILALQDLNEDGVSLRGLDAPGAELVDINLSKANLSAANLSETDLSNANLSYANLDHANLSQSKLSGANLSHANLSFARLSHVNFSSANLSSAKLLCADLSHANMSGVNLKNASLSGANLDGTYLTGANLKGAKVSLSELSGAFLEGAIMPDGSKHRSSKV